MELNKGQKIVVISSLFLTICIVAGMFAYKIYISSKNAPKTVQQNVQLNILPAGPVGEFEQCQKLDYDKTPGYGDNVQDVFYKIADIISAKAKDEGACSTLPSQVYRDICYKFYYKALTIIGGTIKYLDKLPAEEEISGRAYLEKNEAICDSLEDQIIKNSCKTAVSLDKNYCDFGGDTTYDTIGKPICLNAFHFAKALREKNMDECDSIENIKSGVPIVDKNSSDKHKSLAEGEITDNISGRVQQLFCRSLVSDNPKDEINKYFRENVCYERYANEVAKLKNDQSLCEKIPLKDTHNKPRYVDCVGQFE